MQKKQLKKLLVKVGLCEEGIDEFFEDPDYKDLPPAKIYKQLESDNFWNLYNKVLTRKQLVKLSDQAEKINNQYSFDQYTEEIIAETKLFMKQWPYQKIIKRLIVAAKQIK